MIVLIYNLTVLYFVQNYYDLQPIFGLTVFPSGVHQQLPELF